MTDARPEHEGTQEEAETQERNPLEDLERETAELRALAEERFERLQRLAAELENTRKRAHRQLEQQRLYALEGFLKDLLPTIDNLERAMQSARESGDLEGLLEGLELVDRDLHQTLERHGVVPVEALGRPFDPFEQEAVDVDVESDQPPGTVTSVLARGYRLNDRVLRPARVCVAQGPQEEATEVE